MDNKISINDELKNELLNTSIDLSKDYFELALDSFFEDGIFKEVPIVSTLYSVFKVGNSIKDAYFVKKVMIFLKEFESKTIEPEKLNKFKSEIDNDNEYKNKVMEQVIILLEKFDNSFKAKVYGNLFAAFVDEKFDWDNFQFLSSCIDNLFMNDFDVLNVLNEKKIYNVNTHKSNINMNFASIQRLRSCGLVDDGCRRGESIKADIDRDYKLSDLGNKFYNYCLENKI